MNETVEKRKTAGNIEQMINVLEKFGFFTLIAPESQPTFVDDVTITHFARVVFIKLKYLIVILFIKKKNKITLNFVLNVSLLPVPG